MTSHGTRHPLNQLLESLHAHFGTNIKETTNNALELLEQIDINSRIIDAIHNALRDTYSDGDSQKVACSDILDEIFADFSQAMYLFSVGLIVPARMLVRRALELGVASVYMWDIPHEYWGWRKHDDDLGFSKMIEHLSSERYTTYLTNICGQKICNQGAFKDFKDFYRSLSNTVHGKSDYLAPLSPERYKSNDNNIETHLETTINVQCALLKLWCGRFVGLGSIIETQFPHRLSRGNT